MLTFVLVFAILTSVFALVFFTSAPSGNEHFSEFYILGSDGQTTGYPNNLTVGESAQVILGIINHEYRTVNYTIEVWLANSTYVNNATTMHHLLFVSGLSLALDHIPVNTEGNWTQEWHEFYNFSVPQPGVYKIWFVLLQETEPFPGVIGHDYVGTLTENRFLDIVNSNKYCLNLNLNVNS